jgi:hypothetical protein
MQQWGDNNDDEDMGFYEDYPGGALMEGGGTPPCDYEVYEKR